MADKPTRAPAEHKPPVKTFDGGTTVAASAAHTAGGEIPIAYGAGSRIKKPTAGKSRLAREPSALAQALGDAPETAGSTSSWAQESAVQSQEDATADPAAYDSAGELEIAEPVLLAQAVVPEVAASQAAAAAEATAATATTASVTTAAVGASVATASVLPAVFALGVLGVAAAGSSSTSSTSGVVATDTVNPTVTSVAISGATGALNSTLNVGDVVTVTVSMSESTIVSGSATINLMIGSTTVQAAYTAGSGTTALTFSYTITSGQTDANGIAVVANSLAGTLKDAAGNSATLTHSAATDHASYLVDTAAPTVSSVALTSATNALSNTLNAGDTVTATVTMSEATTVTGTPTLALNIGGTTVYASYASGSGTSALLFTYTITSETDTNGISIAANSVALNSGTLKDAAGNAATLTHAAVADNSSYLVDTSTPAIVSLTASSSDHTVTLTYDGTLDPDHPPLAASFTVTSGGVDKPVTLVSVVGSVVTLTVPTLVAAGNVTVAYADPTSTDDANAIQDAAGNDATGFSLARVADGYLRGATVQVLDSNDAVLWTGTTDANGNFFIPQGISGTIVASGGINIDTGVVNTVSLKAPTGSTAINPLTTLVQAVVKASGATPAAAAASVASSLGLTITVGQDLLSYDPIASDNVAAQKAAAQIATIVALAEAGTSGAGASVLTNLATVFSAATTSGDTVDLADSSTISSMLDGITLDTSVQSAISDASAAISVATTIAAVSTAQSHALDLTAPVAPSAISASASTSDTTPTVRLSFNTTATDGTAVVAGDVITLKDSNVQVGATFTLLAADITAGYKDVVPSVALAEGAHSLTASITDQAGNASSASVSAAVTVDTTAPSAPTISVVAVDGVVSSSEQTSIISGTAEAGSTVSLSIGGATRSATALSGGSWSYTLVAADITAMGQGAETLSATATDAAGNTSSAGTQSLTVDTIAPTLTAAPTLAITSSVDTLLSGGTATITFTFSEAPSGFSSSDITTSGGALSGLAVSSSNSCVYTATFTADGTEAISITAAIGAIADVAGNSSTAASSSPSISLSYSVTVSDAYVTGATTYLDLAGDGSYNAGTDILATAGATSGVYTFVVPQGTDTSNAKIVTSGGYDTVSDGAVDAMSSSFGNTVVSAMSTLYAAATSDEARAALLTQYGLSSYSDTDPYANLSSTDAATAAVAQELLVKNQAMLAVTKNINSIIPLFLEQLHVSATAVQIKDQTNKEIAALTLSDATTAGKMFSTTVADAAVGIQTVFDKVLTAFHVENAAQYSAAYTAAATAIASVSASLMQFAAGDNLATLKTGGNAAVQQTGSDALATDLATFIAAYFAASTDSAKATLVSNLTATYSSDTMPTLGSSLNLKQALQTLVQFRTDYANAHPGASEQEINTAIANATPISGAREITGLLFGQEIANPKQAITRRDVEDIASGKGLIIGDDITMVLSEHDLTPHSRGISLNRYSLSKYMDSGLDFVKYQADFAADTPTGVAKVNIKTLEAAPTGADRVIEVDIGGFGSLAGDVSLVSVNAPGAVGPKMKKIPVFDENLNVVVMVDARDDSADHRADGVINIRPSVFNLEEAHIDSIDAQGAQFNGQNFKVNINLGKFDTLFDKPLVAGASGFAHGLTFDSNLDVTLKIDGSMAPTTAAGGSWRGLSEIQAKNLAYFFNTLADSGVDVLSITSATKNAINASFAAHGLGDLASQLDSPEHHRADLFNVDEAPVMVITGASWATSFDEGMLSSKLHMDVPEPSRASVALDTVNQQLDFSARGSYGLEAYYYRDDAPIVWADLPTVQLGQSWSVQTRVSINDGLAEPQQSAGIAFYDADGGVPNFYFSLAKWIQATSTLSSVAGVATQSGSGNGISGEAYSLLAPETSDVYLKVQVTELGQTDHYQFFYKGLLAQDPWIAVGDARTYTSKGNDSRVGLFYKTNQVTAGVTFDDFAITVPVSVAENSTGTVYTANATADASSILTYALSGTDSALFSINASTGKLAFKAAPNFEDPLDDDGDNLYDLTVTASDGVTTSVPQSVVIAVTNVVEQSAVNVTVAPAQVTEGDAGKLFYTFTRSSDLDGELTVNIGVAGTANTEDYSLPMQSQWTRLLGASRDSQGQPSAAVGADGAVYVSGRADTALLDGTNVLSESGGGYVRKFDADGSLMWTRLTDAVNDNYPYSVTTGVNGGVYVAGMAYNPAAYYDGFVTKFDDDGELEWTSFVGGPDYDNIKSLSTDAMGAVYVAGFSANNDWSQRSSFLSKLTPEGDLEWTRPVDGSDHFKTVSAASDGAVYVTGYSNSAILDGANKLGENGSYVSKYDADGNLEWTRLPDASGSSQTNSISAGADSAVYVAGYSYGNSGQDGFVTKFDADGDLVWTRLVSGSGNDSVKSVFTGADGAIYVAGETNSSLNGQTIQGVPNTTNGFVVKLDADDGALAWTHLIGGSNNELIKSVSADADGVVYIAGETYSSSLNGQNNQGNVAGFVSKILPASLTQVTFAPGSATATLALKATSDTFVEGNDTVIVTVKPDQAYTVGSSALATGTIEDKPESDGTSVNINSRMDGDISVVGETDLYSIQLTEGKKYIFTLEANSSGLNAGLNLFTTRSASSESLLLTNDNAFYLNNNARITYIAQETGTYYIQANGVSGTLGDYVLSVSDSDVPTPEVEFQIPSAVTGDLTTEISWRSQEFYLYVNTPSNVLPTWENAEAPVKPTLVEVNGSGSVVELLTNIIDWGRPTIQSGTSNLLPDTNYVYTIARGAIKDSNGLTNDYYESTIFHTSADIIGPVAIKGGVATGTHASGTYAYLTGFSSLDVATPGQTLSIPTSPDTLFVQFNEPVRWPAGGWNQEWSAAASNGVIDGVYLVENDVRVYEFGVAYIPARGNYEVGSIHLDLENETGSDTPNNDEAIWLDLRHGFKSGYDYELGESIDVPVGYTLKEGATYTLVFDVGMYDPMLNFSEPTTPPFEFSFIVGSQVL